MAFYSSANFEPDCSIGYLIKRNFRFCVDALTPVFAEEGLTFTQWQALISIHFQRATTGAELADDLAHDKGATTRLIDTLEERGWIVRTRNEGDRRCVNLTLTPAGEAMAKQARRRVIECWNGWLADWETTEVEALIASLQRLERTLGRAVETAPCA